MAATWITLAALAFAQVAILQIKVVEGEGAVHLPGVRSLRPLTIEVTDETGRPVPGAPVSFHLPEDGPGGTFANGLRTEIVITDAHGRATLRGILANRVGGRFQVRILVSKEQARAGTVSFQYVAESKVAASSTAPTANHKKWIAIGLGVASGAIAALVASRGSSSLPSAAPVVLPRPTLTIGFPAITVGRP